MKNRLVIDRSTGFSNVIASNLVDTNISLTKQKNSHQNLTHYNHNVLRDELPKINAIAPFLYSTSSINSKQIVNKIANMAGFLISDQVFEIDCGIASFKI